MQLDDIRHDWQMLTDVWEVCESCPMCLPMINGFQESAFSL